MHGRKVEQEKKKLLNSGGSFENKIKLTLTWKMSNFERTQTCKKNNA